MDLQGNIVSYCRTHALKARDSKRHVDVEIFTIAANEIERLQAIVAQITTVAESGILPDGDHVDTSTGMWLEELVIEAGGE